MMEEVPLTRSWSWHTQAAPPLSAPLLRIRAAWEGRGLWENEACVEEPSRRQLPAAATDADRVRVRARAHVCAARGPQEARAGGLVSRQRRQARWPTPELDAEFAGERACQRKGKGGWLVSSHCAAGSQLKHKRLPHDNEMKQYVKYVFSLLAEAAESEQGGPHVCSSLRVPQRALQLRGPLGFDSHCGSSQLFGQVWLHLSFGWGTKMHREHAAAPVPLGRAGEDLVLIRAAPSCRVPLGWAGEDLVLVYAAPSCRVPLSSRPPLPHPSRCIFTMLGLAASSGALEAPGSQSPLWGRGSSPSPWRAPDSDRSDCIAVVLAKYARIILKTSAGTTETDPGGEGTRRTQARPGALPHGLGAGGPPASVDVRVPSPISSPEARTDLGPAGGDRGDRHRRGRSRVTPADTTESLQTTPFSRSWLS
ncbi:unnamed protein product [Rangifer tarandus platyrhynchus]|uniref:Uncharacterized protein n=2 Tax=Rangifer tarandus platyrhynchus TaxID=3082113 RepID=A0ACB0FKF8_RANTA|nr:unnamed protein product [Rangifer tarandus platyrhynchus]CAI9712679.1 unnamed protein product [Rangifer tarandus platyrhynchus]